MNNTKMEAIQYIHQIISELKQTRRFRDTVSKEYMIEELEVIEKKLDTALEKQRETIKNDGKTYILGKIIRDLRLYGDTSYTYEGLERYLRAEIKSLTPQKDEK